MVHDTDNRLYKGQYYTWPFGKYPLRFPTLSFQKVVILNVPTQRTLHGWQLRTPATDLSCKRGEAWSLGLLSTLTRSLQTPAREAGCRSGTPTDQWEHACLCVQPTFSCVAFAIHKWR